MAENLDPRQIAFLENYLTPGGGTYSNALQSALKAGYSQEYAEKITSVTPQWMSESIRNSGEITAEEIIAGIIKETQSENPRDRLKAWELLAKHKGLFSDKLRVEHHNQPVLGPEAAEVIRNALSEIETRDLAEAPTS